MLPMKTTSGTPASQVASYCGMAYYPGVKPGDSVGPWKTVIATTEKGCGGIAILAYGTSELFLCLRGTNEVSDWWRHNLRILPTRCKATGAFVHSGFERAGREATGDLLSKINEGVKSVYTTVYCGHSLGGASAVTAALAACGPSSNFEVMTFGAPRALSAKASAILRVCSKSTVQFGCQSDIVFRCPPALSGYRHAADISFINRDGAVDESSSIISRKLDAMRGLVGDITNMQVDSIADHAIVRYQESLLCHENQQLSQLPLRSCRRS